MTTAEKMSFCRICSGGCGTVVTVGANNEILSVRGDPQNPLTTGYACFKGLQAEESHHGPARLLHPLKRQPDGSYTRIPSEQAIDEIASKISVMLDRHGPEAVAVFCGNGSMFSAAAYFMHRSFLQAIGSDQYFSTLTIDQSAKYVSAGRLGMWAAGYPKFEDMEVAILFGANPLVSHASLGFLASDPVRSLKRARAKGLKLIVVDPRNSETARNADLVLQPYPGQDAAIAGAIIRIVLEENWHDVAFCSRYIKPGGMQELWCAVEPLTEVYVEERAGLKPGQIRAVAELFARDSKVGSVYGATGTAMQPFSNLAQHMVDCLNTICGRFLREGGERHRFSPLDPVTPAYAEVVPPMRAWEATGLSRIRGHHDLYGERPSATLTDEILTPGKGRIRGLILGGGNPLTSFPDQSKTVQALQSIELLVSIDPWQTPGFSFAHYVLPPLMQYERADLPLNLPGYAMWPGCWGQYTEPVIAAPEGSDLVHDWYIYWSIAKRLGRTINYFGKGTLSIEETPTCDDLFSLLLKDSPTSLEELKRHPHGLFVDVGQHQVQPARAEASGKFDPMPHDVADELKRFLAKQDRPGEFTRQGRRFTHLLSTRRMRDLFNSNGTKVSSIRQRTPCNAAYLNPVDLNALGIAAGDRIELESAHGRVIAIAGEDQHIRPGVVSMATGWGSLPGSNEGPEAVGTSVNALIDTDIHYESINAMPHMSAVPVTIIPLG